MNLRIFKNTRYIAFVKYPTDPSRGNYLTEEPHTTISMNIRQRHMLKKADIKELKTTLYELFDEVVINELLTDKPKVEFLRLDNKEEIIVINNILSFWITQGRYIPCLTLLLQPDIKFEMKSVTVDKGAIRFVANGADIMRPGITVIDDTIQKGDIIKIQEETHRRSLAVGMAMFDAAEMQKMTKGKVIKTIHFVNDPVWEFSKTFR
ncbi:MAG: RNA-binding protein [Promethearchaeota archaeon]|nr:MAG: RNA-binding protein [Candidatus Lokiarchaeota archaeon]